MNNPCKNKSYRAVLKILLEIEDLQFSSKHEFEFEVSGYKDLDEDELIHECLTQFSEQYGDSFNGIDTITEIISINKN